MTMMKGNVLWEPFAVCPVHRSSGCRFESLGRFRDRSGLVGNVTIERCTGCGLGVTRPPIPDVSVLYQDRTSQDFQPQASGFAERIKRLAFKRQARALLAMIPGSPRTIVDYGCGSGIFTRSLAEVTDAAIHALDFHEAPPADLGRVAYRPFSRADELQASADLVIALHALEHDDNPADFIGRLLELVAPGGHVLFEVPNIDCVWADVFGSYWDGWYVPYHRLHFSRASLRAAVQSCGLEVVREAPACVPTIGRTLANIAGMSNSLPFLLAGAALYPLQRGLEFATRRPSALRIIGRKP